MTELCHRAILLALAGYRSFLSPFLPPSCRFFPSCSAYTLEAIERYGIARGLWLSSRRLARCRPGHLGGYDPVR